MPTNDRQFYRHTACVETYQGRVRASSPTENQFAGGMVAMALFEADTILFDRVSDTIVILDAQQPELPIIAANRACRDLVALDGAAITGQPWDTILAPTTAHGVPELIQRSIATGEPFAAKGIPYVLGAGVRPPLRPQQLTYWNWQGTPVRGPAGQIVHLVLIMTDVTVQHTAGQSDQEKDAFLSLISHEIRTPLTAIKGFAQLGTRSTTGTDGKLERTARYLRNITQQADRIGHLIGNLSDAARLHSGRLQLEPAIFDLVSLVRTTVTQRPLDYDTRPIDLALTDERLLVRADQARIEQALAHLLTNAAKYSANAGRIAVTLDRQGNNAHLAVRDWGIGIPRDEIARIFGRFYRATNGAAHGRGGLGLGLFVTYQIVTGSGGRIYAESEEGRGSTFHITLPLVQADGKRRKVGSPRVDLAGQAHESRPPTSADLTSPPFTP